MTTATASSLRIILLGAGRIASQLGLVLLQAGHQVPYVWSRTTTSAATLAAMLPGTQVLPDLNLMALPPADVYLLAVSDAAVPAVLAQAQFPKGAVVAHTSGAVPLAIFNNYSHVQGGVFYPVQTFSVGRSLNWQTVPLCIEATTPTAEATLLALAHTLSASVQRIDTAQRQVVHLAAVFACNFPNHLFGISRALLQEQQLPLALLGPLIQETVEKALANPPFTVQTGPAARQDEPTLARHQGMLTAYPDWLALYNVLSDNIKKQQAEDSLNKQGGEEL